VYAILGHIVRRGWFLLLAGWVLVVAVTWWAAPPWAEVAQDKEFAFLPKGSPSLRSDAMFARAFPHDHLASNVVLVVHRDAAAPGGLDRALKFIEDDLEPGLRDIAASEGGLADAPPPADEPLFSSGGAAAPQRPAAERSIIARIRTPNAPGQGALLVSEDQQVLLVVVELTTEFLSTHNWKTLTKIEDLVGDLRRDGKVPAGTDVAVTGSAVIGRDHNLAQLQSARNTEWLTVILVIALLVLIYRAPLLAVIPLATVVLAVQVARNVLAILAHAGYLTLFQGIEIYITILAYGAGVDYCLFLTARYKEELDAGKTPADAVDGAVRGVGAALVASAFTVMCGIGMMVFAEFGKFREAGIAIPLSIFLALVATLTFSASLLRLAGRWAFWPRRQASPERAPRPTPSGWRAFFRPGALERVWERVGHLLERRPGTSWLVTAGAMAPFAVAALLLYHYLSYNLIGELPAQAPSVVGTRILAQHFPAGILGPVSVLVVDPHADFKSPEGRDLAARVTDQLRDRRQELGLADVRSLTAPLGITPAAQHGLAAFHVPADVRREMEQRAAAEHYVTDLGERGNTGTRLDVVLDAGPFSDRAVADLGRVEQVIREALAAGARQDTQVYMAGPTASVRDLQTVVRRDRARIEVLVLAGVLVILVVLLRRVLIPVYLLLSVLFSYYATLGVTFLVFWLLDPHGFTGIDWKVAIFLFTILIAVGEDYNIFLMARVGEEERRHGPVGGVIQALDRTGPIISSCGIIMAGTFASLLGGSLNDMKQLGFALAFGVLLDTFVVRPVLVPSFLILLHSGRLHLPGWVRAVSAAGPLRRTKGEEAHHSRAAGS
jgi:RND superfamily putative drug exporter